MWPGRGGADGSEDFPLGHGRRAGEGDARDNRIDRGQVSKELSLRRGYQTGGQFLPYSRVT